MKISLLTGLIIFISSASHAQIYQWVDEKGKTHFSDKAPADQTKKTISKPKFSTEPDTAHQKQLYEQQRLLDAYSGRRASNKQQKTEETLTLKEKRASRDKKCNRKKKYLKKGGAVYTTDDAGNRVFLTEPQLKKYRAKKEASYVKDCL